jgi:hypothetical protein
VIFGIDRGGETISLLTRIANRDGGNQAKCCSALALVEHGMDPYYANLQKTIFYDNFIVNKYLQQLLDDELLAFTIIVGDATKDYYQSTCHIVRPIGIEEQSTIEDVQFTIST